MEEIMRSLTPLLKAQDGLLMQLMFPMRELNCTILQVDFWLVPLPTLLVYMNLKSHKETILLGLSIEQ